MKPFALPFSTIFSVSLPLPFRFLFAIGVSSFHFYAHAPRPRALMLTRFLAVLVCCGFRFPTRIHLPRDPSHDGHRLSAGTPSLFFLRALRLLLLLLLLLRP